MQFPPDKGDPRWRVKTDRLFLGIDHTAIVVRDTETSLKFYREMLGLKVTGKSENHGIEQERLNNVFGARLRIKTLRAEHGPAIEFLEYLSPRNGRTYPADAKSNDIFHWQIRVRSSNLALVSQKLAAKNSRFVSSRVVALPDEKLGFAKGLVARDPDGHHLMFAE